jgi:alpha-beta hydrolase superfamily lysophospholipase
MLLRIILSSVVVYLALTALVFLFQRRLLYHPSVNPLSASDLQTLGLQYWPDSATDYRGFINTGVNAPVKGTIMVFHGNAGAASDRLYYTRALAPLGYRVLLMEYPGYGGRAGKLSEASFIADAKQSIALAHRRFGSPLLLWGESLGAGVVAALAADATLPIAGVALITPWDSLTRLAQRLYRFLPVRWLVRDPYDSVRNLQAYDKPVAVLVAARDEIIPKAHGLRLYESIQSPQKKLWVFEQGGHNNWPRLPQEPWWWEVMHFLRGILD